MASETPPSRCICCAVRFGKAASGAVFEPHPERPGLCLAHGAIAIENEKRAAVDAAKEQR